VKTKTRAGPLVLLVLSACGPGAEKRDRDAVISALERVQAVPSQDHEGRKRLADELLALELDSDRARKARDACGAYYKALADSNLTTEALQRELSDPGKKSDPKDIAERLAAAEKLLAEGEEHLDACQAARADLVVEK
jgi:hypothetical protein